MKVERPSKYVNQTIRCGFGFMSLEFMGREIQIGDIYITGLLCA